MGKLFGGINSAKDIFGKNSVFAKVSKPMSKVSEVVGNFAGATMGMPKLGSAISSLNMSGRLTNAAENTRGGAKFGDALLHPKKYAEQFAIMPDGRRPEEKKGGSGAIGLIGGAGVGFMVGGPIGAVVGGLAGLFITKPKA